VSAREHLTGYPQEARDQFEFLLARAQTGIIFKEDHNYWIDQMATHKVRQVLLKIGRRLKRAGSVDDSNDMFYLTGAEIRQAALEDGEGNRKALVAERKTEMEHFGVIEPPSLGTPMPESGKPQAIGKAFAKFFGSPSRDSGSPGLIVGNAGSPGVVTGTARIIRSLSESERLNPGDVLVTATTLTSWTPLFGSASGVGNDPGGVLSHCAIVAREDGIPAVVGTGTGTSVIRDGQTIEVNGNAGEVRILASPADDSNG